MMLQDELYHVLIKNYERYPLMRLTDYYKLIHQAIFGPKHFSSKPDKEEFLNYLENELKDISFNEETKLIEYIGHGFYRVDLKVVISKRISKEVLIDGFYKTMLLDLGNKENRLTLMNHSLHTLKSFLKEQSLLDYLSEFDEFITELKQKNYPAVHHSEIYVSHYHPHYRVIHQNFLDIEHLK